MVGKKTTKYSFPTIKKSSNAPFTNHQSLSLCTVTPRKLFEEKHIALALQGGGAHGAFTWGVLDRLLEVEEIVAEGICGTSAGAVNAVALAYGLHMGGPPRAKELLEKLWKKIAQQGSYLFKPSP